MSAADLQIFQRFSQDRYNYMPEANQCKPYLYDTGTAKWLYMFLAYYEPELGGSWVLGYTRRRIDIPDSWKPVTFIPTERFDSDWEPYPLHIYNWYSYYGQGNKVVVTWYADRLPAGWHGPVGTQFVKTGTIRSDGLIDWGPDIRLGSGIEGIYGIQPWVYGDGTNFYARGEAQNVEENKYHYLYVSEDEGETWDYKGYCGELADWTTDMVFTIPWQSGLRVDRFLFGTGDYINAQPRNLALHPSSTCGAERLLTPDPAAVWQPEIGPCACGILCDDEMHFVFKADTTPPSIVHYKCNAYGNPWTKIGKVADLPLPGGGRGPAWTQGHLTCIWDSVEGKLHIFWLRGSDASKYPRLLCYRHYIPGSDTYGPIRVLHTFPTVEDADYLTAYPYPIDRKILLQWDKSEYVVIDAFWRHDGMRVATFQLSTLVSGVYPSPLEVETDAWGGVLVIDPLGKRTPTRGPIYFLLDSLTLKPGLTDRSGVFHGTLNDNENPKHWSMYLLREGTEYIQDQDEFWIGVQRNSYAESELPYEDLWSPAIGGPGEGRRWIMGGFISKRYYTVEGKGRITAHIRGKDYMDLWHDQPFGTPEKPRNYKNNPTDLALVFYNLLDDVNDISGMLSHRQPFTPHLTYCPARSYLTSDAEQGAANVYVDDATPFPTPRFEAIIVDDKHPFGERVTVWGKDEWMNRLAILSPYIQEDDGYRVSENAYILATIDLNLQKEFRNIPAFNVMRDFCEELGWEWKIDHLKQVWWYDRADAPQPTNSTVRWEENIRTVPELMMGDTSELITDVIIKDGILNSIPPEISGWMVPESWRDLTAGDSRSWNAVTPPAPPNFVERLWVDDSLVWDDEGYVALCWQKSDQNKFDLNLTFSRKEDFPQMEIDMREWRRLKFKWRHATRLDEGGGTWAVKRVIFLDHDLIEKAVVIIVLRDFSVYPMEYTEYWYVEGSGIDPYTGRPYQWSRGSSITEARDNLIEAINTKPDFLHGVILGFGTETEPGINAVTADGSANEVNIRASWQWVPFLGYVPELYEVRETTGGWGLQIGYIDVGEYWMYLMHDENRGYKYRFGAINSHQLAQGYTDHDEIRDRNWHPIDLLLPVPEEDGTILEENLRGWEPHIEEGSGFEEYTGSIINYVRIIVRINSDEELQIGEFSPYIYGFLSEDADEGKSLLWMGDPLKLGGYTEETEFIQDSYLFYQPQEYILMETPAGTPPKRGTVWLLGYMDREGGFRPEAPTDESGNVLAIVPLDQDWDQGDRIYPRTGYSISISQLHFERNIRAEDTADNPLGPPWRYKVVNRPEMEYMREADAAVTRELEQDGMAKRWARVVLDGDPEKDVGTLLITYFDPDHLAIFNNLPMVVDDAEFIVEAADFYTTLTLTPLLQRAKPRALTEVEVLESHEVKISDLGKAKTPLTKTIRGERGMRAR